MNIYDRLKQDGVRTAHHESDLYVEVSDVSRRIIEEYLADKRLPNRPTLFQSADPRDNGKLWYELPFAYSPFWRSRGLDG